MMVNMDNKYTTPVEYYYNPYIDMYCVVDTRIATEDLDYLKGLWESSDLLTEVSIPDYVTSDDYDGPTW